jgi:hypothetical protein
MALTHTERGGGGRETPHKTARGFTKLPRHTPIDTHRARESHAFVVRPGEREGERDRERVREGGRGGRKGGRGRE